MRFLTHPKKDRVLRLLSENIVKLLNDFFDYRKLNIRKLRAIKDFITHWKPKHWNIMEREINNEKILNLIDIKEIKRDIKFNATTIRKVSSALNKEKDPEVRELLEELLHFMNALNVIFGMLREILIEQIEWLDKNKDHFWTEDGEIKMQRERIQEFIRLVKNEATLLYEHGLPGKPSEAELLVEIYNHIMPMKDRVRKIEELSGGQVGINSLYEALGGNDFVFKRIGRKKEWTRENAAARAQLMMDYYRFLRSQGVPVPSEYNVHVIAELEKKEMEKGINPTGKFQVAVKQRYFGPSCKTFIMGETDEQKIINLFNKMLDATHKATRRYRTLTPWLYDFTPTNFCVDTLGNIVFVDIDPPGGIGDKFSPINPTSFERTQLSLAKKLPNHVFFRRCTIYGAFIMLAESAIDNRKDLEILFITLTLEFLEKHRPDIYKFMRKYFDRSNRRFRNAVTGTIR